MLPPGAHRVELELWNGEATETTEVFVYVPAEKDSHPRLRPLLHVAHGTGGNGGFAPQMWREVADSIGMIVVAPSESGPNQGYRFDPREREIARAAIRWAQRSFPIDARRIHLTGISRGGHLTWDVALRFPDLAASIAPMIGGPRWNPNGQNNLRFLENLVQLPIRDLQGLKDDPRMIANLQLAFDALEKFGATDAQFVTFPERGHSFDFDAVDWIELFGQTTRNSRPEKVVRVAATPGEGRAFWVEVLAYDKSVKDRFRPTISASIARRGEEAQRRHINQRAVSLSARLDARLLKPGSVRVRRKGVAKYRLLLDDSMLGTSKRVLVRDGSRTHRPKPERSAQVLLREFVDRLDRSFLPVFEWRSK